ncbi:MAG: hypothetical protein NC930_09655 [Candidatus Omnitrophica bacterium]|nr:hypothetical protein [Candidatus Omnitrophota bacterium]
MPKLKRGLQDISPLFGFQGHQRLRDQSISIRPRSLEILSVFSPDGTEDSLLLSTFLASRLNSNDCPVSMITINNDQRQDSGDAGRKPHRESGLRHLRHVELTWDQFEKIASSPLQDACGLNLSPQVLFLIFDYKQVTRLTKILPVIDKWILIGQPTFESFAEIYKMMKAARFLNTHLDYFLILEGDLSFSQASFLFEKFSELVAAQLGINIAWLGSFEFSRDLQKASTPMALEHLFFESHPIVKSPSQFTLVQFVQSLPEAEVRNAG